MKIELNNFILFCSQNICCNEVIETFLICSLKEANYYDEDNDEIIYHWKDKYNLKTNIDNLDLLFFYRVDFIDEISLDLIKMKFPNFLNYKLSYYSKIYYGTTCPVCGNLQEPKITSIQLLEDDYWWKEIEINHIATINGYFIAIPFKFFLQNHEEFGNIEEIELFNNFLREKFKMDNDEEVETIEDILQIVESAEEQGFDYIKTKHLKIWLESIIKFKDKNK